MKILFLSHHWSDNSHHSSHSGMQKIVTYAAMNNDVTLVTWGPEDREYLDENVRVITVRASGKDYLFSKRKAISRMGAAIEKEFDVVHSLYSDCTFHLPPKRFTMTLHVLPGAVVYKEFKQRLFLFLKYHILQVRAFRRAKHIACVSTNLLNAIPGKYKAKACFIPHGVDTDFWNPALAKAPVAFPEGRYVLCVGSHGLDRTLLTAFIRSNPAIPFALVGTRETLGDYPNVHYLSNISDEDLRDLYFGAGLMLRPLLFATANNSILEALAMGKTVLASRIPGVTDYLTDDTCLFIDTLEGNSLAGMQELRLNPVAIRQATLQKFGWHSVFNNYLAIYNQ
jgi:glycosyltransferase involved in cell wall biosynthesis